MAAAKGNKYSLGKKNGAKLKTPALKKEAYAQYCQHISEGKAKKSWYFEHPDLTITWETMEKYIASDKSTFDPIHKEIAMAKGYQLWEEIVTQSAKGLNKDANTATLQMVMRNKYDWDRPERQKEDNSAPLIKILAERWRKE